MWALWLFIGSAFAHGGAVPIRGVYDWSQLPDAAPGAWIVWTLFPSVVIGCLLFVVVYELMAGPWRRKWDLSPVGPTVRDRVLFHTAIAIVFVSLQGPLHELADVYLFSGHMVQHLLITLVFPPMALLGIPGWMWKPVTDKPWALAIGRALTRPTVTVLLPVFVLFGWHVPRMYEAALYDHNVHIAEHLSFMAAYVVLWWPAMTRSEALPALSPGWRMAYLFGQTLPMKLLGALLTMADYVLYPYYAQQDRVFGMDPMTDQRLGGLIMWLPGGLVFWVTIAYTFFVFYRQDEPAGRHAPARPASLAHARS